MFLEISLHLSFHSNLLKTKAFKRHLIIQIDFNPFQSQFTFSMSLTVSSFSVSTPTYSECLNKYWDCYKHDKIANL